MKKNDLAARLACITRSTPAAAADELDRIVHRIIRSLKEGRPARLPGLGTFRPSTSGNGFRFEPVSRNSAPPPARR